MSQQFDGRLREELDSFRREGIHKKLNYLEGPQASRVRMEGHGDRTDPARAPGST